MKNQNKSIEINSFLQNLYEAEQDFTPTVKQKQEKLVANKTEKN